MIYFPLYETPHAFKSFSVYRKEIKIVKKEMKTVIEVVDKSSEKGMVKSIKFKG